MMLMLSIEDVAASKRLKTIHALLTASRAIFQPRWVRRLHVNMPEKWSTFTRVTQIYAIQG